MSALRYSYRGLIVPVFTPFKNNSEKAVNTYLVPRYSDYLRSKNISGVLVNGTTGEGMAMSVTERQQIAEAWSEVAKKNCQHLIVQVGGAAMADVKKMASHAQCLNVDAILCLPELYYKPSNPEELIDYMKEISDAAPDTPLLYYHYPIKSNVTMHMGQFLESVGDKVPTLVGIKFTSTNLEEAAHALRVDDGRFVLFLGSNQILPAGAVAGIDSFMPSSTNLFPELIQDILSSCKKGGYLSVKPVQERLVRAIEKLSQLGDIIASMKASMSHLSPIEVGPTRRPLPSLESESDQLKLRTILKSLN